VAVYVVDGAGEVVAAARMEGASPESRHVARSRAAAAAVGGSQPAAGVPALDQDRHVGGVGISGLPGGGDDALAAAAIEAAGLRPASR
jgi:uncharacterized protein GlcG (DUF336 family)